MGVISYKKTPTDDGTWDAGAQKKKLGDNESDLRAAHAWVDSAEDPTTKGAYKFIHHFVGEDGSVGAASTVACSSGIGILNGGREGTNIPEGDRGGVHAHLAHHLEDAGKDAPELKSGRRRTVRAWDSSEMPPHPHDDMSHEHAHTADDGSIYAHSHTHHHDDGTVGHESDAHDHTSLDAFGGRTKHRSTRAGDPLVHPHDTASHAHTHTSDDPKDPAGTVYSHQHAHSHGDGSFDHQSEAHDHSGVNAAKEKYSASDPDNDNDTDVVSLGRRRPREATRARAFNDRASSGERLARMTMRPPHLRAKQDGSKAINGHAAVFGQMTQIEDWFGVYMEKCDAGCFNKTLNDGADVRCLFNHDPNIVLGRTKSGTLRLNTDDMGLVYDCDPPPTQFARDLMASMERGDIDGSSFGFRIVRDRWGTVLDPDGDQEQDMLDCRTILEVQLYDVSPVTFPAYPQTDSALRNELRRTGFDVDSVTRILLRSSRGLPMLPHQVEMLRDAISHLQRLLSSGNAPAPTRSGHARARRDPAPPALTSHGDDALLEQFMRFEQTIKG
jgi:HK97 family phage prohead protease